MTEESSTLQTTAAFLVGALLGALAWAGQAGAPLLCPDPETGAYGPESCDLILPIERDPRAVECSFVTMFSHGRLAVVPRDPICADFWAREEPALVLQLLHEQRQREAAPED